MWGTVQKGPAGQVTAEVHLYQRGKSDTVVREQYADNLKDPNDDALRKIELGSTHSPLGPWLLGHTWLFAPLSAISLATELLAPLALLGVRVAAVWCVCAWSFHAGVLALMAIAFPYPLSGCAFAAFFPLERALDALLGLALPRC